jgi:hypothetical protein
MALYFSKGKTGLALLAAAVLALAYWPFRCHHRHLSWPRREKRINKPTDSYVICLDCGREFGYDWNQMHIVKEMRRIKKRVVRLQNVHAISNSGSRVDRLDNPAAHASEE